MPIVNILLYCRPGFEKECTSEILAITQNANIYGFIKAKENSGFVVFHCKTKVSLEQLNEAILFKDFIFIRQCVFVTDILKNLPTDDRITPILELIKQLNLTFNDAWLETPDTNEGKQLSSFCKKFSTPLLNTLKQNNLFNKKSQHRLHLFFLSSSAVYVGASHIDNSSNLVMGIPRLKMPRSAPSRSTLKLDEAFKTMLNQQEQDTLLCNGMTAVDLGACPGGWTWQLVQRGIKVFAIDNGPMNDELMDSGMVEHVKADGFKYSPDKTVDWLVCDMVERPLHISQLISRWLVEGKCQYAAFNLKLPMKKRYDIIMQCKQNIEQNLMAAGLRKTLRIKHLYHDREEITCIII